jgi:uracil-DNA glycosylase
MRIDIPRDWMEAVGAELEKPYFKALEAFVDRERQTHAVFPPEKDVFNAFKATPFRELKVLLLGQDPYHDAGQAHGMCFSVRPKVQPPPSLRNIFKELQGDVGAAIPNHGHLEPWARRGVLLLNAVLTVRAHAPASHARQGWELFTDAVIRAVSARAAPAVFLLWGGTARKKKPLIDLERHRVVEGAHPSPLSAKAFFGTRPFSAVNRALAELGQAPIDWRLPDL